MKIYWLSRVYADGSGRREVYGTIERLPDASLTLRGRDESPDSGEMRWAMDHDRRCLAARLGREPTNDELFDFIATEGNYSRHDRIRVHRPGDPNVIRFTEGRPYYCDEESIRESAIACFECYGEIPEVPEWTDRSRSAISPLRETIRSRYRRRRMRWWWSM